MLSYGRFTGCRIPTGRPALASRLCTDKSSRRQAFQGGITVTVGNVGEASTLLKASSTRQIIGMADHPTVLERYATLREVLAPHIAGVDVLLCPTLWRSTLSPICQ